MKKLFLIDGSGVLYRSYYGLPAMIGPDGTNVNVLYGFAKMILRLLFEQPDHFFIARDLPKKTLRHKKFSEYKGTRPKIEDDLKIQIPKTQELIRQMGIPSLGVEGYEADDILATYAKQGDKLGYHVTIYSSDKDLKQLLTDNVIIKDPAKYYQPSTVASFVQQYHFQPKSLLAYLSLMGDASDNIPGVLGIGAKGAQKLIATYGDLDTLYTHIDEIGGKLQEKLLTGKESAYYSRELVDLMDVPGIPTIETLTYTISIKDWQQLLVNQRGFQSLAKTITELDKKYNQPKEISLF